MSGYVFATAGLLAAESSESLSFGDVVFKLLVILFFVLLNGFFVASEFAIVKVRGSQLATLADEGSRHAIFARKVTGHLDAYLSATQLGITIASIVLGMLGEPFVARLFEPLFRIFVPVGHEETLHRISLFLAFGFITFLHVVLGELTPKSLAIRKSLITTLWVVRPLHFFYVVLKPAIWILNGSANAVLKHVFRIDPLGVDGHSHSSEELRLIVRASEEADQVTETEREILINALQLSELVVRDIMRPRNEVVTLDPDDPFEENLRIAVESRYTRFPLVNGHLDQTLGFVHIKDMIPLIGSNGPDLLKIRKKAEVVPEMMTADRLLNHFLGRSLHMAVVVDEFGGAVGVVSLEDVLEELVGEIRDEFDEDEKSEQPFIQVADGEFVVEGGLPLYELEEHTGLHWEDPEVSTVGGYVTHRFGRLPVEGESIEVEGFVVTVENTDGKRILQMRFQRHNGEVEAGETGTVRSPEGLGNTEGI
ncbi:MAG TPA: hemolysin family protein [Verrucomicrobiales bacterium]|nr:hemolysin family protein [Verrucomicrobiales bacterium]